MIRVRYKSHLSPGLHGTAERGTRGTTVYLVPGLTGGQRRAALRRLKQEARRGCGPALPGPDLTVALAADRFRAGLRNTAAVVRLHPAGSLLPTAVAGLLMTLFVLSSVSAKMAQMPQPPAAGGPIGGAAKVIGYPSLAQTPPPADPDSSGHGGGAGGEPAPSWSLAASSGYGGQGSGVPGNGGHGNRGRGAGANKVCAPAQDRASVADRACRPRLPATRLPWPPPPGGWPHFWPAERSSP